MRPSSRMGGAEMGPQSGQMLSHYRLIEKIGEGGMGVVWKAEDAILGRAVAIKVLPPDAARDDRRREMFLAEARLASSVSEASIVQTYEFGREGDLDFIVMEYVEGKPLNRILHGRPLPAEKVVEIGVQVARALSRTHRRGVLHRDLKPSNILVTSDGDAKVVNFGLATLLARRDTTISSDPPDLSSVSTLTDALAPKRQQPGAIAGTLPYMSREQVHGKTIDARSDIFSLGVVLYEMTTGQRPFRGSTSADLAGEILKCRPDAVHELVPKVPLELDRILQKALAQRPGDRYQTMEDLAVDLRRLGRDIESGSSPSYQELQATLLGRQRKKFRRVVLLSVAAAAALALGEWAAWKSIGGGSGAGLQQGPIEKLAVLPFQNAGQDPNMDYLCAGIMDTLINN